MALTVAQRAIIADVINRLEQGSSGKFLDSTSIERLALVFAETPPYVCGCPGTFQEGMRDTPFSTLLTVLLAVTA